MQSPRADGYIFSQPAAGCTGTVSEAQPLGGHSQREGSSRGLTSAFSQALSGVHSPRAGGLIYAQPAAGCAGTVVGAHTSRACSQREGSSHGQTSAFSMAHTPSAQDDAEHELPHALDSQMSDYAAPLGVPALAHRGAASPINIQPTAQFGDPFNKSQELGHLPGSFEARAGAFADPWASGFAQEHASLFAASSPIGAHSSRFSSHFNSSAPTGNLSAFEFPYSSRELVGSAPSPHAPITARRQVAPCYMPPSPAPQPHTDSDRADPRGGGVAAAYFDVTCGGAPEQPPQHTALARNSNLMRTSAVAGLVQVRTRDDNPDSSDGMRASGSTDSFRGSPGAELEVTQAWQDCEFAADAARAAVLQESDDVQPWRPLQPIRTQSMQHGRASADADGGARPQLGAHRATQSMPHGRHRIISRAVDMPDAVQEEESGEFGRRPTLAETRRHQSRFSKNLARSRRDCA